MTERNESRAAPTVNKTALCKTLFTRQRLHTDRVVKFSDAGVDEVISFTPVDIGAASLQLVPENRVNVAHVWTSPVEWTTTLCSLWSSSRLEQNKTTTGGKSVV